MRSQVIATAIALRRQAAPAFFIVLALGAVAVRLVSFAGQPLFGSDVRSLVQAAIDQDNWSSNNDRRFAGLKRLLPPRGAVGYINDAHLHPSQPDTAGYHYQAQYALAPVSVEWFAPARPNRHEYVIGDFREPVDLAAISATLGVAVVQDFGNGVVLFRRAETQP